MLGRWRERQQDTSVTLVGLWLQVASVERRPKIQVLYFESLLLAHSSIVSCVHTVRAGGSLFWAIL